MLNSFDGDIVEFEMISAREAKIINIKERRKSRFVGIIRKKKKRFLFIQPAKKIK